MPGSDSLSRVSVIIPTYNRSKLLRLAVESVLAQTYPNIEIIVVDDGSTDDTAEVMAQYAGRIVYVRRETNSGGKGNLRLGLQSATGVYINFLDHDDLFMPAKLERQVQVLDSRPEIGLVHCGYYHIDKDGNRLEKVTFLPDGTLKGLLLANPIWSGAPLIRRECMDEPGLFDDAIWYSDYGILLRLALAGYQFACVQEPLGAYRILPGSQMSDVAGVESFIINLLDKVFTDPSLPADVRAVREQAYGYIQLWLSWNYYNSGQWHDAQRNLAQALTLMPHLIEQPEELIDSLCGNDLGVRIKDPLKFVSDVLDHLPPSAGTFCQYRQRILARVYIGLALRNYGFGDLEEAKYQIEEAIGLNPALLEDTDEFAKLLLQYAVKLPINTPNNYVETVLQNLPSAAQQLTSVRSRVMSDVNVACAFQDYFAGQRLRVVQQVLTALQNRPSLIKNRGVISIFVRSLLGPLTGE